MDTKIAFFTEKHCEVTLSKEDRHYTPILEEITGLQERRPTARPLNSLWCTERDCLPENHWLIGQFQNR